MPARLRARSAAALAALSLVACQKADVGQACAMNVQYADGGYVDVTPPGLDVKCSADRSDYFRSGAIECEALVCLRSTTGPCPGGADTPFQSRSYCSKACVSDSDCFTKETGLVCRTIVLDEAFISQLPKEVRERYLGQLATSSYCATPPLR